MFISLAKMHQPIDWFSWLSKTGLDSSLIYEYGMALSRNELEEGDIAYFNHEFLQSMGISIAKHRLEILKLARKQKGSSGSHPISKLMNSIKKTKRTLANYIHTWVRSDDSGLVLVRRSNYGSGWKGAMLRTNRRMVTFKQANPTLLLTNGYHPMVKSTSIRVNSISSPLDYDLKYDQGKKDSFDGDHRYSSDDEDCGGNGGGGGGGGYLSVNGVREIKWDALFQNLKPT